MAARGARPKRSNASRGSRDLFPDALVIGLEVAVPLHILETAHLSAHQRRATAPKLAEVVATHGDDLMFGGRHCASAFNALARGLALLARQPGGVDFAGQHWCTTRHDRCPKTARPSTAGAVGR